MTNPNRIAGEVTMTGELEKMTPNQRRALNKGLAALETMASMWAAEIQLTDMAQGIADVPHASDRAKRIAAMIEQGFIEGAYRHYLDHKDALELLSASKPAARGDALVDDLSTLVVRLVRELRKASPASDLPTKALEYLYRKDLSPAVLRGGKFGEFAAPAAPAHSGKPVNGIPATLRHDEGAVSRCSYCGRYSLDPKTLSDRQPKCECGELHGWSGSFKKPGPDASWSGTAPSAPQSSQPAKVGEIPDKCAASGASCLYAPDGRRGEMQCRYCGKPQLSFVAEARAAFEEQFERTIGYKPERYASFNYERDHPQSLWKWWQWAWQARAALPQPNNGICKHNYVNGECKKCGCISVGE